MFLLTLNKLGKNERMKNLLASKILIIHHALTSSLQIAQKSFEKCLTLETGMSDFHKLIITILKVKPDKLPPRIIQYWDHKNFESKAFNNKLHVSLKNFDMNNSSFIELKTILMEFFNKVAPLKTKYLRANYSEFMTKELSKVTMLRTKL